VEFLNSWMSIHTSPPNRKIPATLNVPWKICETSPAGYTHEKAAQRSLKGQVEWYISDLAWFRLGVEPTELSEIVLPEENFLRTTWDSIWITADDAYLVDEIYSARSCLILCWEKIPFSRHCIWDCCWPKGVSSPPRAAALRPSAEEKRPWK